MQNESLNGLKAAFEKWRASKRHVREAIPEALIERAHRLARVHGVMSVWRVTKVDRARLRSGSQALVNVASSVREAPLYSRLEVSAARGPFAEVETPTGLRVRFFTQSDEALGLLSSLCSTGGER